MLVLSERERVVVTARRDPLLEELSEIFGSRVAARQTLLVHLATEDEVVSHVDVIESTAKEA